MNTKATTEDDIAAYLINTPDFFERNADLLASIQLTSPHGQRAVSLQERQMELLREKIKGLELHMANIIRAGNENSLSYQKLLDWILPLLHERTATRIPYKVVSGLQHFFNVPQIALRLWGFDNAFTSSLYAQPVSGNVQSFVNSMNGEPFCGQETKLEAASWLDDAESIRSIAMLPLYTQSPQQAFGLIVLGSPDAQRFAPDMGVDMLKQMALVASAALSRCLAAPESGFED